MKSWSSSNTVGVLKNRFSVKMPGTPVGKILEKIPVRELVFGKAIGRLSVY